MAYIIFFCERPARRSNQSILKEISPDTHWKNWSWSWSSNALVTWCKEQTMSLFQWEKTLMLRKVEGGLKTKIEVEGEVDDRMRWLDGITDSMDMSLSKWCSKLSSSGSWWWTGKPGVLQSMGSQRHDCEWTELWKT